MGRLARDPEIRYSAGANPIAVVRYTLAVDRQISRERKDAGEQSADFINCTCFGKDAEFVAKFYQKGQLVSVVGRIQVRNYDDQGGNRRWVTEVITNEHFFAESRASFEGRNESANNNQNDTDVSSSQSDNNSNPQSQSHTQPQSQSQDDTSPNDTFYEVDNSLADDNLPF